MEPINLRDRDVVSKLIQERHWDGCESIRSIERSIGVGKTVVAAWCKRHGIKVRPRDIQTSMMMKAREPKRGSTHWAWGLRKETSPVMAAHSNRMTRLNPSRVSTVAGRIAISRADFMREHPTHCEAIANGIISSGGVPYRSQFPVLSYILDFAFVAFKVAVEIDGHGHDSPVRKESDLIRDKSLIDQGWTIIRVPNSHLTRTGDWLSVVKQFVPDFQIPSDLPPGYVGRKYRVIVRDAKSPSGRKM